MKAAAKVNLTLEVYGTRPDGYHALRSLVAPISLADEIDVEPAADGVVTSDTGFPDDLCVKAATVLRSAANRSDGVRIHVTKRIPVGGGLGGGSADAAATLRALNELWHLGKTPEALADLGAAVGSDVPALVLAQHYRRVVLMEGRGERVSLWEGEISPRHLVLANPGINVSTAEVYRLCTARTTPADAWVNDLEAPAVGRHPEIARTLEALKAAGATGVMMSGSGATCFGFADDRSAAETIAGRLADGGFKAWAAEIQGE